MSHALFGPSRTRGCIRRAGCAKGFPGRRPWRYLRFSATLLVQAFRLVIFALLVLPACLCIGLSYFRSPQIARAVRYGPRPRQLLDIYFPTKEASGCPVVITVMGGAWIIGHRLWNVLLAWRLAACGVMVVAVDYRNYPMATIPEMLDDLDLALAYIKDNLASYGADLETSPVALVGQSAGAQLAAALLLRQCRREVEDLEGKLPWSPSMFKVFVGVSGVYDLPMEVEHLETIGIVPFLSRLSADGDLASISPSLMLQEESYSKAAGRHPPVHLFHGQADTSVPLEMSTGFARALRKANVPVEVYLQKGATHSEPVVEGPLGGEDIQAQLILPRLKGQGGTYAPPSRFMPRSVLAVAKWVMPF